MAEHETGAELAHRIARATAEELQNIIHVKAAYLREPLDLAVRMAVLRAFDCGCTPGRRMAFAQGTDFATAVYFEDITCPLHGIGPVAAPGEDLPEGGGPPTRSDPGD